MAVKKHLYTVVFLALIAFKVSSATVHIHLHHEHDEEEHTEDCTLCDHAIYYQNIEFSTPEYTETPSQTKIAVKSFLADDMESQPERNSFEHYFFTRPPPAL